MKKLFLLLIITSTALFAGDVNILNLITGSFVSGVFLTFTPCVLPMMPILSGIIVGRGESLSKAKAIYLSMLYVLGTATTYALMGALAGATGEQLQAYFQNVWAISFISFIFFIMSLSMFGLFELQLPSSLQSKLSGKANKIKGGDAGVFFLGMISALVIGACVSPILISFLGIAISNADPILGATTMFSMALGMGVPLVILAYGAGSLLPKAGDWMITIKKVFGVLLLSTAIYIFNTLNLVEPLFIWGTFFIILSVYLNAWRPLKYDVSGWMQLFKGFGIVLAVWGVILIFGGLNQEKDIFKPLKNIMTSKGSGLVEIKNTMFYTVNNKKELDKAREEAKEKGKPLFVYFYKETCSLCNKLEMTTYQDKKVIKILSDKFISVKVNISNPLDKGTNQLRKDFEVFGAPSFVFYTPDGTFDGMDYGYQSPEGFHDLLELTLD